MRYYRLPPEEWNRLDDLLALHNKTAPPQQVSTAIVGENEAGDIVFVGFLTLAFHFENLIGMPNSGGSVTALHKVLDSGLLEQLPAGESLTYYTNVRDEPRVLEMAARNGLIPMDGYIPHYKSIIKSADA